jgi:hypothetical protein
MAAQLEALQRGDADHEMTIEQIQGASAILYLAGTETVCLVHSLPLRHPELLTIPRPPLQFRYSFLPCCLTQNAKSKLRKKLTG